MNETEPMVVEWEKLDGRTLQLGDEGDPVEELQEGLTLGGWDPNGIDEIFGRGTRAAVRQLQGWAGLTVDGVFGPRSLAALKRRLAEPLIITPSTPTIITSVSLAPHVLINKNRKKIDSCVNKEYKIRLAVNEFQPL